MRSLHAPFRAVFFCLRTIQFFFFFNFGSDSFRSIPGQTPSSKQTQRNYQLFINLPKKIPIIGYLNRKQQTTVLRLPFNHLRINLFENWNHPKKQQQNIRKVNDVWLKRSWINWPAAVRFRQQNGWKEWPRAKKSHRIENWLGLFWTEGDANVCDAQRWKKLRYNIRLSGHNKRPECRIEFEYKCRTEDFAGFMYDSRLLDKVGFVFCYGTTNVLEGVEDEKKGKVTKDQKERERGGEVFKQNPWTAHQPAFYRAVLSVWCFIIFRLLA